MHSLPLSAIHSNKLDGLFKHYSFRIACLWISYSSSFFKRRYMVYYTLYRHSNTQWGTFHMKKYLSIMSLLYCMYAGLFLKS